MTGKAEKVYSEAVFELAKEQGNADEVKEELDALAEIFDSAPELGKFLTVPTVTIGEKLSVIERTFKGKISDTSYNLLCVAAENGRAALIPGIAADYRERWYEMKNIAEVKVTTSIPLSDTLRIKLKAKLEAVMKKTVILTENVDPSIMGGIILNYGNTMTDGSVRSKLDALQKQIKGVIA